MKFSTKAIHSGYEADPNTGAVMPPIYMTSTFELEAPEKSRGFDYTRANNPNFVILEKTLASLESSLYATVFSSGMGALTGLISTLSKGDKVLTINGIYGGTYRLFNHIFNRFGVEFLNVPYSFEEIELALKLKPKWVLFETPTNPLLNIFDIKSIADLAKKYDAITIVDNTFASPYCQNPLSLGADIVWHSTTKYISGHSDVLGGVIISNHAELKKQLDFSRKTLGLNPSPFDTWLITRGVKTLAVRMERQQNNALAFAKYLENHAKIKSVYYPGLPSHPYHSVASKQMHGFSAMVSADFDMNLEQTKKFVSSLKLFSLAESLGGIESLVCHPMTMTHAILPEKERLKQGISEGLVRFSIGLEDVEDLTNDLENAFNFVELE